MVEEFYNRIVARAETGYFFARDQSRAVIDVLEEAVTPGQIDNVRDSLPDEFGELFD